MRNLLRFVTNFISGRLQTNLVALTGFAVCAALVMLFQNCSNAQFTSDPNFDVTGSGSGSGISPSNELPPPPIDENDRGILGGHFDFDTATRFYDFNRGQTTNHVHEYDDKYDVTGIDFFNMRDRDFDSLSSSIAPSQEFIITVANAAFSPGALIEINGTQHPVQTYQSSQSLTRYTLTATTVTRLSSLSLRFKANTFSANGLIATSTDCVRSNKPGPNGSYRNGALLVQIHDAASFRLDPATGAAAANGGLLWEGAVFWHKNQTCAN